MKVRAPIARQPRGRPPAPDQAAPAAPPAPMPLELSGSHIAEIKVLGKGVKNNYKLETTGGRAVDSRAGGIHADYKRKAAGSGLEVSNICRRLSTAAVHATSTVLLARASQIGQGQ